ncbi:hypothetical protein ANSO36C_35840 [Nostoc cf. commune SO-36]|uniref:Uncharacterized protein n=1 Tax=Nostoc cf. commune SO-36 TaxID=449208 RepID=A0ABM7Z428_NOSCO|nr:hypothetical protein [Nostoc commune]BDI17782.1 hypothetical protein ANSO36C_35840 [Nostoc cf. commune SO-36]
MTTIIFVHGTGGRRDSYAGTFRNIEQKLHELKPEVRLVPCLWGEVHGTKLNAGGLSIPNYDSTRVNAKSQEDEEILLWKNLYKDPLYEINLLSFRQPRGQANIRGKMMTPPQEISKRIEGLTTSSQLETQLQKAGISQVFEEACNAIRTSQPFSRLLDTASRPLDADYAAIARAIVTASIQICDICDPPIHHNKKLRDETVDSITRELTQDTQSRGVIGDLGKILISP